MGILPNYFCNEGPGAALAVAVDGQDPYVECCGLADLDDRVAISPDTMFDLASAGKTFTAAAILLLAQRGVIELNQPVDECLRPVHRPAASRPMTIVDLLQHTSGLPDYLESGVYSDPAKVTVQFIAGVLPEWSRQARPGERFSYSNTNYVVLAMLIEAVSGSSYADFVHANLVKPYDLGRTKVMAPASMPIARGYRDVGTGLPDFVPFESLALDTVGDGGVHSSLSDLIHWQRLLWNGEIVSERFLEQMRQPGTLDSGETFAYGLGIQVEHDRGAIWCGHNGSWADSTVLVGRYVHEKTTVIVLSNEVMAPVERIGRRAWELLGPA